MRKSKRLEKKVRTRFNKLLVLLGKRDMGWYHKQRGAHVRVFERLVDLVMGHAKAAALAELAV